MAKGQKTGGRQAGTPNRTTRELRILFRDFVSNNIEKLQSDFDRLPPEKRINLLIKISGMIIPPPQQYDIWEENTLIDIPDDVLIKALNRLEGETE
jgi:hypothetical protein